MKTIVIYHRADFDGIFCREIARKFLPKHTEFIGWDYGDPTPIVPPVCDLYILDLSVDELMDHGGLVWIDHHKSAIETYSQSIRGYRIDGVAACRLAWQWFVHHLSQSGSLGTLPQKDAYVKRMVAEPVAVRLAGEYDIWDKRDPDADLFQHGLRSRELDTLAWDSLLSMGAGSGAFVGGLLESGRAIQYAKTQENADIIRAYGFTVHFAGLCFLACNHARFNSFLFTAGLKPEHDALLGFNFTGRDWRVSLYHAPGKVHHDLSTIAVKHGGGGHRGACGFRASSLPFLT